MKATSLMLSALLVMSCKQQPITMNLYYTGENGSARKFMEEMESSGTASAIRAEEGNEWLEPVTDSIYDSLK